MRNSVARLLTLFAILPAVAAAGAAAEQPVIPQATHQLLRNYCFQCHGGDVQEPKGDLDLQKLQGNANSDNLSVWRDVVDRLSSGDMPPAKAKRLPGAERERLLEQLQSYIAAAQPDDYIGHAVVRRLTQREYYHTLGVLFPRQFAPPRFRMKGFFGQPSIPVNFEWQQGNEDRSGGSKQLRKSSLPEDTGSESGFLNQGRHMRMSAEDLDKYLGAAQEVMERMRTHRGSGEGWLHERNFRNPTSVEEHLGTNLRIFAETAWRRPLTDAEFDELMAFYAQQVQAGFSPQQAAAQTGIVVLTSPHFLFVFNGQRLAQQVEGVQPIDDWSLASRLSYFLWLTPPDEELKQLAVDGTLQDPVILRQQVRRMLKDPRAMGLLEGFATQWLNLDDIQSLAPDETVFAAFYDRRFQEGRAGKLSTFLWQEPLMHLQTVIVEDRSVLELVDVEYGYLNRPLAEFYGLREDFNRSLGPWEKKVREEFTKDKTGEELERQKKRSEEHIRNARGVWAKVPLPDRTRGGLLTCGGILAMTSAPTEHNPILRGNWVLKTLFNRPPPPPPAGVDAQPLEIQAQQNEELPLRDVLAMHRANVTCAACHDRIDPYGIAFEHYDGIGRYRTTLDEKPIDAAGTLPDGRGFDGPVTFKDRLNETSNRFRRGLTEKLLSYATGRAIDSRDRPTVDRVMQKLKADDDRFSRLVVEVVLSKPFRYIDPSAAKLDESPTNPPKE